MTTKEAFLGRLAVLAQLCPGFILSPEIIAVYDKALAPLGYERVCHALDTVITNRRGRDPFPSPRDIKEIIDPSVDMKSEAVLAVSRILDATTRFSSGIYESPEDWVKLQSRIAEYVGELAWEVIKYNGGWQKLCELSADVDRGILRAQLRDVAEAILKRAASGTLGKLPTLPGPPQETNTTQISSVIKGLLPDHMKKGSHE